MPDFQDLVVPQSAHDIDWFKDDRLFSVAVCVRPLSVAFRQTFPQQDVTAVAHFIMAPDADIAEGIARTGLRDEFNNCQLVEDEDYEMPHCSTVEVPRIFLEKLREFEEMKS